MFTMAFLRAKIFLISMDLGHFNDTVGRVIAGAELAGGKRQYPASNRERISLTNPLTFSRRFMK